uniref:Arrestin-like N-terminal domain-containing protein n=1 Tax=Ditylenchus dipsaci TaxID=166011 RepID=A0A915DPP9_9BILA
MVDIFRIEIFSDTGVFFPGQPVNGRLIAALREPVKARAVVVYVVGRAHTYWEESRSNGSHNTTDVYTAEFVYLNLQIPVWLPNNPTFPFVPAGMQEFPFHFTLPLNCPPSFEGFYGFIRYFCRAKIDRPWRVDDTTATAFTVMPIFDLNLVLYANSSVGRQFSEMITTCCCCDHGRIIVDASVSKCGLVPGETAVVLVNVQNLSSKYVYQIEIVLNEISRNVGQHCGYCRTRTGVRCVLRFVVPHSSSRKEVQGNSVILKGNYTLTNSEYVHFQRTIRLPEEADAAAVTFDLTDPMFLRFSCPISDRGALEDYSKAKIDGATELKIFKFSTGRICPNNGVYSTDTCGFPAANIVLDASKNGFVLKGSWVTAIGDFVHFSRNVKVDDGRKYSTFVKENEGSLLTVTGVEH